MEEKPVLNQHNKAEYPPMHTAEHILNGTAEVSGRSPESDAGDPCGGNQWKRKRLCISGFHAPGRRLQSWFIYFATSGKDQ